MSSHELVTKESHPCLTPLNVEDLILHIIPEIIIGKRLPVETRKDLERSGRKIIIDCESLFTYRCQQTSDAHTVRVVNSQTLQVVFNRWRTYTTKVSDFKWRMYMGQAKRVFTALLEGVEKTKKLNQGKELIEGARNFKLVERGFAHWLDLQQQIDQDSKLSELALQSYATALLVKSIRGWRALYHTNMILSERFSIFQTARGSALLSRAFQSLSVHRQTARKENAIYSVAEDYSDRKLMAKVLHSLTAYAGSKKEKRVWTKSAMDEISKISLRLNLNRWRTKVWRRNQINEAVATVEFALILVVFRKIASIKKVQEEKIRLARTTLPLVKRRIAFYGWKSLVHRRKWEEQKVEEFRANAQDSLTRGALEVWVHQTKCILDDRNREMAASGFYEIKILVNCFQQRKRLSSR